jgi:iron complex outermembrane receptor protein
VVVAAGTDTAITIALRSQGDRLEAITVSATRIERRIEETPLRIEVLDRDEVEEKMLMTPGDITMMLNETGGLRVQNTSPSLGGANVRVQGLRGRYTLMLSDGLPLSGGQSGTLGLLQIPPMDLAQVEVIKGVASALYGSSALGGVIDLVSRRPGPEPSREVLLNQTTRNGTDAVLWSAEQLSPSWGYTLLASGNRQTRTDIDGDGWTDMPGYERVVVRPRVFWNDDDGASVMLTVGSTLERREGGTLPSFSNGSPFRESLRTVRNDGGAIARFPLGTSVLAVRGSGSLQHHDQWFGDVRERDDHRTWFTEASLATTFARYTTVVGGAFQRESYRGADVARFDYTYDVPATFAQVDAELTPAVSLSLSARADFHSRYGTFFSPRASGLYEFADGWTLRLSVGTGAFAPTPFTEETEATGLTPLRTPGPLRVERARGASIDLGGALGPFEMNATLFASSIRDALVVRGAPDDIEALEMFNASRPTRTHGADGLLRYRAGELVTTASYTFVDSREQRPDGAGLRAVPLTPRHTAGLVSVWERDDVGRVGIEAYYTGSQPLDHNPYLTRSRAYTLFGAIAERRLGRYRVFMNLENLGDVRMTNHQPLARPIRGEGGRWTMDAWAPLEGRVINGGVRIDVGRSAD